MDDRRIYVGGLTAQITRTDLLNHFSQFGNVAKVDLITKPTATSGNSIAFVSFVQPETVATVLAIRLHEVKGLSLHVGPAYTREEVATRAAERDECVALSPARRVFACVRLSG